jgi:hypothetical protein
VQAFGWRRSGDGFEFEEVGDRFAGRWKFDIRSVDDFRGEGRAAGDVNALDAVMGFLASGVAGFAGLRAA